MELCKKEREHFNSHAHVERDQSAFLRRSLTGNFNSHAHVERDMKEVEKNEKTV